MLATIGDDTWWHMIRAQHAAHNPKFEKTELFRHPGSGHKYIKGPAHMAKGGHYPREAHSPHPLESTKYLALMVEFWSMYSYHFEKELSCCSVRTFLQITYEITT